MINRRQREQLQSKANKLKTHHANHIYINCTAKRTFQQNKTKRNQTKAKMPPQQAVTIATIYLYLKYISCPNNTASNQK